MSAGDRAILAVVVITRESEVVVVLVAFVPVAVMPVVFVFVLVLDDLVMMVAGTMGELQDRLAAELHTHHDPRHGEQERGNEQPGKGASSSRWQSHSHRIH